MPELPEVETVRRGLEGALKGAVIRKVILRRKNLRIPFPEGMAKRLEGQKIISIDRRAKYLLFYLDGVDVLISHLGMTGRFICHPTQVAGSGHDHVIIELGDGRTLIYNDARRFGLMTITPKNALKTHPLLAEMGPEPFDKAFSATYLKTELAKRKIPIKVALMDQKLVVGVGNIYASEALFLAKINPQKPANKIPQNTIETLIISIQKTLQNAIDSGGSSLRDFLHVSGEAGYFQHHFNVYGRKGKPCFQCGTPIRGMGLSGRSTFYCPLCQG